MLFPIIRVIDNDSQRKAPHIVGTNSHDVLEIDKKTGGIHYLNLQCSEGTTKYNGKSTFSFSGVDDDYFGLGRASKWSALTAFVRFTWSRQN